MTTRRIYQSSPPTSKHTNSEPHRLSDKTRCQCLCQLSDDKAYYHYARSLGLCGRCKQRDALTDMAYCLECRTAMQGYNHKRKGPPRKVYVTKFVRQVESSRKEGRCL